MFKPCKHIQVSDHHTLIEKADLVEKELSDGRILRSWKCKTCGKEVGYSIFDIWA